MQQHYVKTLVQQKRFMRLFPDASEEQRSWLHLFFTEKSEPDREFEFQLMKNHSILNKNNDEKLLYPPDVFRKALNVVFETKKLRIIKNYFYREYYNNSNCSPKLVVKFIKEPYNPFRYMGVKHTFYFIVKCMIGYKRKPV